MAGKQYTYAEIVSNTQISGDIFDLTLKTKEIAELAKPGQFVNIYLDRADMLLPRPLSICDATQDTIRLIYRTVGKGTDHLSTLTSGTLKLLAPLGNGFPIPDSPKKIALVGGGLGIPPLLFLAKTCLSLAPTAILGFRDHPFMLQSFTECNIDTRVATDDGSTGFKGSALDLLKTLGAFDIIYACGPKPMLKALAAYAAKTNTPCFISLEERMACGFGVCIGCVCPTVDGYKKVCVDGPVFNAASVLFD